MRESCGDPRLAQKCHDVNDDTLNNDCTSDGNMVEDKSVDNNNEDDPSSAGNNDTHEHVDDDMTDNDSVIPIENDDDPDDECNMDHEMNPVNLSLHFEGSYILILGPCQWKQCKPYREMSLNWDAKMKNVTNHPVLSDDLLTVI